MRKRLWGHSSPFIHRFTTLPPLSSPLSLTLTLSLTRTHTLAHTLPPSRIDTTHHGRYRPYRRGDVSHFIVPSHILTKFCLGLYSLGGGGDSGSETGKDQTNGKGAKRAG